MLRFSLFGIPITVQPWFWLTLAILGGALHANSRTAVLLLCLFILAGFLSVLVHELGHALTGKAFGARTAITLFAFGGYASFPMGAFTRTQNFLVTAAGPFVQILLGAIFLGIASFLPPPGASGNLLPYFIFYTWMISFVWAILNLIPVLPLDGGRLMDALMGPRRQRTTLKISMIIAIVGALIGYVVLHEILLPLFLGMMAWQNWRAIQASA